MWYKRPGDGSSQKDFCCEIKKKRQYYRKVLLSSFYLSDHVLGSRA